MTPTEIDQRETARAEALLQVCRWLTYPTDPLDPHDMATAHVSVACAIQHDLIEDIMRRQAVVNLGLDVLAERWDDLPEDERDVVLGGILASVTNPADDNTVLDGWERLVRFGTQLRQYSRQGEPEERARLEKVYAGQLRMMVRLVIGA